MVDLMFIALDFKFIKEILTRTFAILPFRAGKKTKNAHLKMSHFRGHLLSDEYDS